MAAHHGCKIWQRFTALLPVAAHAWARFTALFRGGAAGWFLSLVGAASPGALALRPLLEAAPAQVAPTVTAGTGPQTLLQLAVDMRKTTAVAMLLDAVTQAGRSRG